MLEANSLSSSRSCVLVNAVRIRLLLGSWLDVLSGNGEKRTVRTGRTLRRPPRNAGHSPVPAEPSLPPSLRGHSPSSSPGGLRPGKLLPGWSPSPQEYRGRLFLPVRTAWTGGLAGSRGASPAHRPGHRQREVPGLPVQPPCAGQATPSPGVFLRQGSPGSPSHPRSAHRCHAGMHPPLPAPAALPTEMQWNCRGSGSG